MKQRPAVLFCCLYILAAQIAWSGSSSSTVDANNFFAFELFAQLEDLPGNFVFSPLSIDTSLAMTGLGAGGTTARQISDVLHLNPGDGHAYLAFSSLRRELIATNVPGCRFEMANALWAQQNYPFLKPYQKAISDQFDSRINFLDLTGWPGVDPAKPAAARQLINAWIAKATHGGIQNMLPEDLPGSSARLILTDAISFKGTWTHSFDPALTKDDIFYTDAGQPVHVPMMHTSAELLCARNDELVMLDMPYASNQFSMVIVLPARRDTPWDLSKMISYILNQPYRSDDLYHPMDRLFQVEVDLSLPKFKQASEFDLKNPLQRMGMRNAFGNGANFSQITPVKPFFIEAFRHEACIEVNEQGTAAAAATAVVLNDGVSLRVNVDHPFLFIIRHNATGAIVFIGRITNPSL